MNGLITKYDEQPLVGDTVGVKDKPKARVTFEHVKQLLFAVLSFDSKQHTEAIS